MSAYRISQEAEADLDDIWVYVARDSGVDTATRLVENIVARFRKLASHPYMGRSRDSDLAQGLRSFPARNYMILYDVHQTDAEEQVNILRIIDSRRDLAVLFSKS